MIYPLLKSIGSDYSIGVLTYIKRFDTYFKPLVSQLEKYFPGVEKNYVLNGHYDPGQAEYLKTAKEFLNKSKDQSNPGNQSNKRKTNKADKIDDWKESEDFEEEKNQ